MKKPLSDVEPLSSSDEERDAYLNERANDAWAKFIMNNQPSALAEYLRVGGKVDAQVRHALVKLLQDDPRGLHGGSKPFRDMETYSSVNLILTMDKFARKPGSHGNSTVSKPISKRQAQVQYAKETGQELRTVELQYRRGREISKKFSN